MTSKTTKTTTTTVDDLVWPYLRGRLAMAEIGRQTERNIACALRSFAAVCGNRPVERISRREVERWLEEIGQLAPSTRRAMLSRVAAFCEWLVERRHLRANPTRGIPKIKEPRALPRAQRPEAVTLLLSKCPDARGRLIVLLMVQEGLRCKEVSGLEFGDVDLVDRTMRVVGKGDHERMLPITDECMEAIESYLAEHPARNGPFIRSYQRPTEALTAGSIGRLVTEWMREAGLKRMPRDRVSAHALRHTCATDMLRKGANPRTVQAVLGHAHLSTTEIYLPLVVGPLSEAMGGRRYRRPPSIDPAGRPVDDAGEPLVLR